MKIKIGILYLGLHNQLEKKFGENALISRKELFTKLGRHSQIPKKLRPVVINEMEKKKLLKKVNRDYVQLIKLDIDIEKESNKLNEIAGLS